MASNAPVPSRSRPLDFMTRITKEIYLYTPDPSQTSAAAASDHKSSVPPPKLILFSSWMGSMDKHIVKYLARYQALTEPKHILFPSWGRSVVRPAVPLIRSILPPSESTDPQPRLLVHLFSNAGNSVLSHLYGLFAETARPGTDDDTALPLHTTVFDSAPGEKSYVGSIVAFSATVPKGWRRMVALPFVHVLVVVLFAYYGLPGNDILQWLANRHNTKTLNREVRRSYVYSEPDVNIPWRGIERHAAQARERGYDVRLEKFDGTDHVAHMPKDPDRYWRIARETWEGWSR